MVREAKRVGPVSGTILGETPGYAVPSSGDHNNLPQFHTAEEKIQEFVERAVKRCGSAAALARELGVKPPTVSQWRAGSRKPDAIKLVHIQELGEEMA